jgi:intracellular sulfur oxidation DsrE/DsrF family protein
MKQRRAVMAGLGAMAAAGTVGVRAAQAQATPALFSPTLHQQDAWMSAMGGKHRVVLDVTSPEGLPDVIRFAGNLLNGHKNGYGVEETDVALLVCLRHGATPYGYTDAIWSKYGKVIDTKAAPPPSANPFNTVDRMQLSALATRGVQFMVCGTATRGISGRIATSQGSDVEAVYKELAAALIPSARIVPAGVVGVVHAQERGFALLHVG